MKHILPLLVLISTATCAQVGASADPFPASPDYDAIRDIFSRTAQVARWTTPNMEGKILATRDVLDAQKKGSAYTAEDISALACLFCGGADEHDLKGIGLINLSKSIVYEPRQIPIPTDTAFFVTKGYTVATGFSHGTLSDLEQLALERIYACVEATQDRRVNVFDIGAGHGLFAWKALVAGWKHTSAPHAEGTPMRGARVIAFEQHGPLLAPGESLKSFFTKAKPYLAPGVLAKDYTALVSGDAVEALAKPGFQNTADVAHLGNMLHYLCPAKATECVRNLFGATRAGGYAFASVHTGLILQNMDIKEGQRTLFDIYREQLARGKRFPAYMMCDVATDSAGAMRVVKVHPLDEEKDHFTPSQLLTGFYKSKLPFHSGKGKTLVQRQHHSFQAYDPASLRTLFVDAGFEVEDLFFLTTHLKREEIVDFGAGYGRFHSAQDALDFTRVCLVARKPQ